MAQKVTVTLTDDLDGGPADETVTFGLDGTTYEIDLSADNARKFRDAVARFVAAARRPEARSNASSTARDTPARPTLDRAQNQAIRDWACKRGMKVSDRGRIPIEVLNRYQQAH